MEHLNARNIATFVGAIALLAVLAAGYTARQAQLAFNQAQDLVSIAQGLQDAYSNQSYQYGAGTIPPAILINSLAVDSSIVSGGALNTRWQNVITLTANGASFSAALPAIPYNICVKLMLNTSLAQYISGIGVASGTIRSPGVSPATAAADCGNTGTVDMTVNYIGHP
jgi:hypothetical protein